MTTLSRKIKFDNNKRYEWINSSNKKKQNKKLKIKKIVINNQLEQNTHNVKNNETRYKHCGVTPHFFTGQNLWKKNIEKRWILT